MIPLLITLPLLSPTQDSMGSFVLPFRQVLYSPYPTTHIDVDINTVKQMPPCHEHTYIQRRYMRSELSVLWKVASEEDVDTGIHTESFTPDLYVLFSSVLPIRLELSMFILLPNTLLDLFEMYQICLVYIYINERNGCYSVFYDH